VGWGHYLLVGALISASVLLIPLGIGRDVLYSLVGASAVVAMLVGVRRNHPLHRRGWFLMAAGTAIWVMGDTLYAWYSDVAFIEPFPSLADVFYLAAYPVLAAGLLVLARSRGAERQPTALLDSAILTAGLGVLSWVFLIEPTWTADGVSMLERLVGVAYPLGDVLLFAMLVRLATAPGAWGIPSRLLAGSVALLILSDSLYLAGSFVPLIGDNLTVLDPGWLISYVLWGAAALHPAMGTLSLPSLKRSERTRAGRFVALAGALLIGPAILGFELITGAPLHAGAVVIASGFLVVLVLVRMVRMVHQVQDQAERLGQLADTDYVTGLANRRRFTDRLSELLGDSRRHVGGLLKIDLERLSEINDTLGHRTGDALLLAAGNRLSQLTGPRALVARLGDSSFGILDPSITSDGQADDAAVRIRMALEQPLDLPDVSVAFEVSIGVLVLPDDGTQAPLALGRVDLALCAAKKRPGRTARYSTELETGATLAPALVGELGDALRDGQIVLHYQPQIEIGSGRVLGVEALARWQHPRHGLLGPDLFIPAAEQTGLIAPFTQHVLDAALRQCARWHRGGLDLTVAVNLSARNLLDPGLVDDVRAALARHCVGAEALELEITESSAMVDPRRSMQVLGELSDLGVTLSVDDYGTGHSSLTYLQRLPVRRLKIDRSFVTGLLGDDASAAIVRSTIELARHLRLDVVAEGVEDDDTLLRLRDMRCFAAQGFGLGRPVAGPLLPELVARIEERLPEVLGSPALRGRPDKPAVIPIF